MPDSGALCSSAEHPCPLLPCLLGLPMGMARVQSRGLLKNGTCQTAHSSKQTFMGTPLPRVSTTVSARPVCLQGSARGLPQEAGPVPPMWAGELPGFHDEIEILPNPQHSLLGPPLVFVGPGWEYKWMEPDLVFQEENKAPRIHGCKTSLKSLNQVGNEYNRRHVPSCHLCPSSPVWVKIPISHPV